MAIIETDSRYNDGTWAIRLTHFNRGWRYWAFLIAEGGAVDGINGPRGEDAMGDLETASTRDELEVAYRRLFDAKIAVICDLSLGAIADIVGGSPPHAPTRWSPAEIRLARAVLILRAACLPPETTQESLDPGNPVLRAADAFNRSQLANYGALCRCGHRYGVHIDAQPSPCEHTTGDKLDPFCHCEAFVLAEAKPDAK